MLGGHEAAGAQAEGEELGLQDRAGVSVRGEPGQAVGRQMRGRERARGGRVQVAPCAGVDVGDDFRAREEEAQTHGRGGWVGGWLAEHRGLRGGVVEGGPGVWRLCVGGVDGVADAFAG